MWPAAGGLLFSKSVHIYSSEDLDVWEIFLTLFVCHKRFFDEGYRLRKKNPWSYAFSSRQTVWAKQHGRKNYGKLPLRRKKLSSTEIDLLL